MEHDIRFNRFGLFAAAALLLAVGCARDPLTETESDGGDYASVSFSIQPEGFQASTRAEELPDSEVKYGSAPHISDGAKADMLVFAVYDGEGELITDLKELGLDEASDEIELKDGSKLVPGDGQVYKNVEKFPVGITLRLKRGETYKVAFWAQEKECKFYDISNLKQVKVHYAEIESGTETSTPNNDESRDAFCRVETVKVESKKTDTRWVYLYRPLAQINVGTTGYDYEAIVQDPQSRYTYSRIQIVTAARYLDVVNDRIVTSEDSRSALEYGFAPIPAYTYCDIPEDLTTLQEKEEFLRVHLYEEGDIANAQGEYMGRTDGKFCDYAHLADSPKKTETFKYLSMCYVLVPSETVYGTDGNNTYGSTTIERMRVWLATGPEDPNPIEILDISKVPVTRNWRTNIVGDIMTTEVPFQVVLDPIYAGDYNGFYEGGAVAWSGPLDGLEAGGAYYDAENDEILISNANGLLWLQQMVNGDLVYTLPNSVDNVQPGDPICYFTDTGKDTYFGAEGEPSEKGIMDPTKDPRYKDHPVAAAQLKARILRATHQDKNVEYDEKSQSWPKYNNFHFVGTDGKAKVKLVADIDMSGIEWLGIGFDCKMDQTADMLLDNNGEKLGADKVTDKTTHRAFFGDFDGNNHTISNLKTKRFSTEVHRRSFQQNRAPYEAVQWYARGFFGQIGGEASIRNLTLRNVDIFGNHCVGGIVGAAIGVDPKNQQKRGKAIVIEGCVVDGGRIENIPMYRGDGEKPEASNEGRTYARGVFTGGIVGLYNASGRVDNCRVSNLTVDGYRTVGGIVGGIDHHYYAYWDTDYKSVLNNYVDKNIEPKSVTGNLVSNALIMADHFKPFSYVQHNTYQEKTSVYSSDWAIGYSWGMGYGSYCMLFVGGEDGYDSDSNSYRPGYYTAGNSADNVQLADFAGYYILNDTKTKILGRTTDIENVPIEELPILSQWFVDDVQIKSNLIGTPSAYKRYRTHEFEFRSKKPSEKFMSPFDQPRSLDVDWIDDSGRVGMHVGAITLDGHNSVFSVREVTGENDCAIQITSCDRSQFTGNTDLSWYTSASPTLKNLTVRGNLYAYTGICLSPNKSMSNGTITISNVLVYDVYQTLALDNLADNTGKVWPQEVRAAGVTLVVDNSNLRGYTVPGAGWKGISYDTVIFERGAHVLSEGDLTTEYTCRVEAPTTFTACTFKAPYNIVIVPGTTVDFKECKAVYAETETPLEVPAGCTKIVIDETGGVTYEP